MGCHMGSHKIDYIIHTIVNISKLRTHQQSIYKNAFVKSFEFVKIGKGRKRKEKEGKFLQFRWSFSGVYHEYTVTADDVKRLLRSSVKIQPDLSCFVQLWFSSDVKASSSFIFSVSTKNSR